MPRRATTWLLIGWMLAWIAAPLRGADPPAPAAPAVSITLSADATDLPRNLLRARLAMPATPGVMDVRYIVWTPGNHTPSGPVENIASLVFRADDRAEPLAWDRDPAAVERFLVRVPEGSKTLRAELTYIAGQPNVNSRTSDSYGRATFGAINWNTVLLYPAGFSHQAIEVQATLTRPAGWRFATALRAARGDESVTYFDAVTIAELIDSPIILGEHLQSFDLRAPGHAPHWLHAVAARPEQATPPEWLRERITSMIAECLAIMPGVPAPSGSYTLPFPRDRYHFLHALGIPGFAGGLEHATSTFIGSGEAAYTDAATSDLEGGGGGLLVIPHEYFHVWCGKLRAPEGLIRPDYSTPPDTSLLWVYEGLTDYYTDVLAVRAGMITEGEFAQTIADTVSIYEQRSGRLWRSVEDTARAARHLRNPGLSWMALRQGQEYYGQGAQFWLEADLLIRRATGGAKSLDDFCRAFFDVPVRPVGDPATYTREDVVKTLAGVCAEADWDALVRDRIELPARTLDLSGLVALTGRRMEFAGDPSPLQKKREGRAESIDLRTSLGLRTSKEGEITDLIPDSPADRAGLAFGMKILGVNGLAWSAERLKDAVKRSPETKRVELIASFQDRIEMKTIDYAGGPRWPRLIPAEGERDWIAEIARPGANRE